MRNTFIIKGKIRGKGRPRVLRSGHTYTPKNTKDYEMLVKESYIAQCGTQNKIKEKPVQVSIHAHFLVPKSYTKKKRKAIKQGDLLPTKTPDIDNIAKIITDALNGVAYKDDKQIVVLSVIKDYVFDYECVAVMIDEYEIDNVSKE